MNKQILCVDDEPHILEGFRRIFRKNFEIHVAEGGEQAMAVLQRKNDFSVIVSDMRMPGMDGVQFFNRAREIAPDSVRIMLTGDAEQATAMKAVNEGEIFRFLTKPCSPEAFGIAIEAGIRQHRLMTAERELLEKTLGKSLQVLIDILAMVNPTAFSRATRVKRLARELAERAAIKNVWEIELAAMLSQIGCVTVPEEILHKITRGEPLEESELQLYQQHPQVGRDLIADIPRMETVAEIIAHQNRCISDDMESIHTTANPSMAAKYACILKIALDFDRLLEFGKSPHEAFRELSKRDNWYDSATLLALRELISEKVEEYVYEKVNVSALEFGMVLDEAVLIDSETVLIAKGTEVTFSMMMKLDKFAASKRIPKLIGVKIPINRTREDAFSLLVKDREHLAFA